MKNSNVSTAFNSYDIRYIAGNNSQFNNTITDDEDIEKIEDESECDTRDNGSNRRYPTRTRHPPGKWYAASTIEYNADIQITTSDDPTLTEAKASTAEERIHWEAAIDEEFRSFEDMDTWEPDEQPQSQPLPTHIVLNIKRMSEGSIDKFIGPIAAGGNFHILGENYLETFAPVVSLLWFAYFSILHWFSTCFGHNWM